MSRAISAPAIARTMIRPETPTRRARWDAPAKGAILMVAAVLLALSIGSGALWATVRDWSSTRLAMTFFLTATVYALIYYSAMVWRVALWLRYRPMESVSDEELPRITVVIPAYNEGPLVRQAILSVGKNRYPSDKLQMICIDDGSTDDTWEHMSAAVAQLGPDANVLLLRQPRNQGKRVALYHGFRRATGDVFVTCDSDAVLAPDALRNGVSPLVRDPRIGAVAGCVEVLNPYESLVTRFLRGTFSLSFKFVRAYQSEFRGVYCTPGAMSIFRAEIVRKVADEWVNETFLGARCTNGEDRHMTNLVLRDGWLTAYQQNAVVRARMPTTYKGLCGMFLRWARSNFRETIFLCRYLFKPFRRDYLGAFRLNMLLMLSTLIVPYFLIANSWILTATNQIYALRHAGLIVLYALTMAAVYYRNERDSDWIWLLFYKVYWVIGLSWIWPYAIFTCRRGGWLTRNTGADRPAQPFATPAMLLSTGPISTEELRPIPVPVAASLPVSASAPVPHAA